MATVEELYEHLEKTIRGYNISADLGQIRAAYEYAREHHGSQLRRDGTPALDLHLGITEQSSVQPFWPWQEDQLTQVFWSAPGARFQVDAWDVYHDGKYLYTEYDIRGT